MTSPASPSAGPLIRPLRSEDRDLLLALLRANRPIFSDGEVETAMELIDTGLAQDPGTPDPYLFLVAEDDEGGVLGYACYGTIPLTTGSFDLYWIAVRPDLQNRGIGRRLLAAAESDMAGRGARLVLVETSSRADYVATRAFYERSGYDVAARIRDFYRPGDDKVVYEKRFA